MRSFQIFINDDRWFFKWSLLLSLFLFLFLYQLINILHILLDNFLLVLILYILSFLSFHSIYMSEIDKNQWIHLLCILCKYMYELWIDEIKIVTLSSRDADAPITFSVRRRYNSQHHSRVQLMSMHEFYRTDVNFLRERTGKEMGREEGHEWENIRATFLHSSSPPIITLFRLYHVMFSYVIRVWRETSI